MVMVLNAYHGDGQKYQTNSKTPRDYGEGKKKLILWIKMMVDQYGTRMDEEKRREWCGKEKIAAS